MQAMTELTKGETYVALSAALYCVLLIQKHLECGNSTLSCVAETMLCDFDNRFGSMLDHTRKDHQPLYMQ